jgi:hypothetical protein
MAGFRHEVQPLILIRNLTTYTPNANGLKACENAYILVGFIFMLVENSPRKCSQQTVVLPPKFKNILPFQNLALLRMYTHAFEAFKIYSYKL